jgi:hypothetical protein
VHYQATDAGIITHLEAQVTVQSNVLTHEQIDAALALELE